MHNTPTTMQDHPLATQEDIEKLISYLDTLYNEEYPHKYTITECYTDKNGTLPLITYELSNIIMECDKGMLIASDKDEILWNEKHYIHAILTDHIEYITFHDELKTITITICGETYGLLIGIDY